MHLDVQAIRHFIILKPQQFTIHRSITCTVKTAENKCVSIALHLKRAGFQCLQVEHRLRNTRKQSVHADRSLDPRKKNEKFESRIGKRLQISEIKIAVHANWSDNAINSQVFCHCPHLVNNQNNLLARIEIRHDLLHASCKTLSLPPPPPASPTPYTHKDSLDEFPPARSFSPNKSLLPTGSVHLIRTPSHRIRTSSATA